jgi:hypothetical protein
LFDCCRGSKSTIKSDNNNDDDNDIDKNKGNDEKEEFSLSEFNLSNFFIGYATIERFVARLDSIGSYFISTFFEVLEKHGETDDWNELFIKVVQLMRFRHGQVPIEEKKNAEYKLAFVKKLVYSRI